MNRILVVRACAVGDFVLNLWALEALHKMRANAQFTLVGYPSTLELARKFVPVEAIHSIESQPWSQLFYQPIPGLAFDAAFVWMRDHAVACNLRLSGIAEVFRADPFPAYGHAAAHLLRTLKLPAPPPPDLWQPESDEIIIHPGSGSAKKNWPHFHRLAARLPQAISLEAAGWPGRFLENRSLTQVSDHLCRCSGYIGNDSGITHLAAYLGCPTIALFGPTDPRVWGPIGRRARVLWKRKLEDISVDEVLLALKWNVRRNRN